MMGISIWQLAIILLIVVLLFGTKRLRALGSDVGGAISGFRKAVTRVTARRSAGKRQAPEPTAFLNRLRLSGQQVRSRPAAHARRQPGCAPALRLHSLRRQRPRRRAGVRHPTVSAAPMPSPLS